MKGLILAGGRGTRLRPITHTGPKQLVPVANKPVIQYAIEDLVEAGITDIGIVLGNKGREAIQAALGDGDSFGVDITYIVQGNPLGLSHAVGCARDFVGNDDVVVYLGDNILKQGISELVEDFRNGDFGAGIALQSVDRPEQFGVADVDADGGITRLVEKPDDPPSNLALIGIYVFSSAVFDAIEDLKPSWRGELEITDAIQLLLERGHEIDSHIVEGWWKDTGKPEDILEANRLVLNDATASVDGTVDPDAEVKGTIDLHETSSIHADAVVRGPVSIGAKSEIGPDTYVGPYTSIGPDTNIRGAHVENSVVMGGAEITTDRKIIDSLIGYGVTVGSAEKLRPDGSRLVVGEHSNLRL
ncbi:glucose-1-phosphate thymidylyltransferase [Halorientalis sp. IM1011]|uniref:glucose-1-phosphate thymidylyltransferase n=1 Tax=Halorientalis sp. IM1011 TaxID=1932360 RepID=UPI00097CD064|nr:glucose-1-phosphate thymidylyltransferase [Halorientalis sp. IM1011]AQL43314.1 glucose-1-phosphate thymidylyltransferase [Halorientalis sp. IM1011]